MTLNSYAKLNLFLQILSRRKDHYHNLKTIFERIDLCDKITLKPRQDNRIRIICANPDVPRDNTNLCFLSAKLLQDIFGVKNGVDIRIKKRIPVGAGLGGGSSNAACVLLGLNKLWRLNLRHAHLAALSVKIGSDVPFFIYDSSFALGRGRGDKITPLKARLKLWHILVVPRLKVSTPKIYQDWDKLSPLTSPRYNDKILKLALRRKNLPLENGILFNSLEPITIRSYPQVQRVKDRLASLGLKAILMSGSGPAIFGIISSRSEGEALRRQLRSAAGSWRVFITRTR